MMLETEKKVIEFYENERKKVLLQELVKSLESKIDEIANKIINLNFDFKTDIKGVNLEKIGSSSISFDSYFEKDLIRNIEKNENILLEIRQQIARYKEEINILDIKNAKMLCIFNILEKEDVEMLKIKYSNSTTRYDALDKFNISKSKYYRNINRILKIINNLMIYDWKYDMVSKKRKDF